LRKEAAMVDLVQYAQSFETDLAFVRDMVTKFEAGTYAAGFRTKDKPWINFTPQTILMYKRMILTYDAALMGVKRKLAENKSAEEKPGAEVSS
jgi:hypothetical protein